MNKPIDFELIQRRKALDDWLADCRRRMGLRFPKIEFDFDRWPIKTLYRTEQRDWCFTQPFADFAAKDVSYRDALRCLVAEKVLAGIPKDLQGPSSYLRLLALAPQSRLFELTLQDLRQLESDRVTYAKENPASANTIYGYLSSLARDIALLGTRGVIPKIGFHVRAEVKAELRKIANAHWVQLRTGKGDLLDRRMEAFNDAFNGMLDNPLVDGNPLLTAMDRLAICLTALLLCAPSRINEILCMSVDDHVTVEDYARKAIGELDVLHRGHQMLIMTMKGSKGAEWSAKPALEFMIDVFHHCVGIIKGQGKRSRMLIEWYQTHPDTLYLPQELEYLRGQDISRTSLAKIILLTENPPHRAVHSSSRRYFIALKGKIFKASNPRTQNCYGGVNTRSSIEFLPWAAVEELLLKKVHQAMADCRKVTTSNYYEGDLSKMLFLFDREELPFLPYAVNYKVIKARLKWNESDRKKTRPPTVFEKLNITLPANGKCQIAELDPHDPRRWLTTMALIHGEKLSDVLINKWANRCRLSQLKNYDFRTTETLAAQSAMPEVAKLTELMDVSNGLAAIERLEDRFDLQTEILTAHDAGIAMTSMDAITRAVENRPVAKTSRGIIVIYPQRFGVCFHQHHEKPCRNYGNDLEASCVTCNEGAYTKGHIPTNDETRKVAKLLLTAVVRHLENLAHTHNRGIADDQGALGEHMLTLVEKGISQKTLEQCAVHLIEEFHQINHLLKDRLLARRLEQSFVTREVVKKLDDPRVANGALIKYHNRTRHAEPLLEIALEAHGGREQAVRDEQALVAKYPQFAPKTMGLTDERHLIAPDDDED